MALRMFVDINGWEWATTPEIDEAEAMVLAIAAGEWGEGAAAAWLRRYLRPSTGG